MARNKKSRSLYSSPVSKASQPSQEEDGGLNPTIGGCSGNASSLDIGRDVKEEVDVKEEKEVEGGVMKKEKKEDVAFPSPLDLPPPLLARDRPRVEETWWRGLKEDAKCVQA